MAVRDGVEATEVARIGAVRVAVADDLPPGHLGALRRVGEQARALKRGDQLHRQVGDHAQVVLDGAERNAARQVLEGSR